MSAAIALVVGLGNPGQQYQYNRHNAGALFLAALAKAYKTELKSESRFKGLTGRTSVDGHEVRLLFPTTYMNNSGDAVQPVAQYYKIEPAQILIAYDELDLPLGTTRLKVGGGPGGHNGVRDVIRALGSPDFARLRLGIGHPGNASLVLNYVLGNFRREEEPAMDDEINKAVALMPLLVQGKLQLAMNQLHTRLR
ncbi:MAG TPA: aminoacyl-tRNA hydrolase [Candidatus Acidoferrum sp.]|nr:aminoacyl-tRNA hydrolase [Candidatus Acidoferrum sp.]